MAKKLRIEVFPAFRPLLAPARYKGIYGGRGSGKSHFFAGLMVASALRKPGFRGVAVREVQKTLAESSKRLIEDKINAMGLGGIFDCQRDRIVTPGGGLILFQGLQDHNAESIKSLEGVDVAWIEEAQTLSARSLEMLRPTIRAPGSEIWASWNPRSDADPVDKFLRGQNAPDGALVVQANYTENKRFPAELEAERLHDLRTLPDRYGHIWLGHYEPIAVGAIWTRQVIERNRRPAEDVPPMTRIVVAVDPAVSSDEGSDEHGVIVCGIGEDGRGYVIDDGSRRGGPRDWAARAVGMLDKHEADAIVIERNQGGDMCRHTLQTVRPGIRIIEVVATRGKHVRAEPIAALYEQDRVSHVGSYPELEAQMCQMTAAGFEGPGSPDRCDAMVWGMTELFPRLTRRAPAKTVRERPNFGQSGWLAA